MAGALPPSQSSSSEHRQRDIDFIARVNSVVSDGGTLSMTDAFKAILRCRDISVGLDGLEASLRISSLPEDCQLAKTGVKFPSRYLNCAWLVDSANCSQTVAADEPTVEAK